MSAKCTKTAGKQEQKRKQMSRGWNKEYTTKKNKKTHPKKTYKYRHRKDDEKDNFKEW